MKWLIPGLALLVMAGCATHYYTTQGDLVSILLKMRKAQEVYFASSLDQFVLHPAQKKEDDLWVVEVPATQSFQYFYMVDGVVYLPDCKLREADDFGAQNCIFIPDRLTATPPLRLTSK